MIVSMSNYPVMPFPAEPIDKALTPFSIGYVKGSARTRLRETGCFEIHKFHTSRLVQQNRRAVKTECHSGMVSRGGIGAG